MVIDPEYGVIVDASVGETVWDDLLKVNCFIVRIDHDKFGNRGYWLSNSYLDGGRFPWEISPPIDLYFSVPRWAMAYVQPRQRFYPMPDSTLRDVIAVAREEEIRRELLDCEDWQLPEEDNDLL